jgi:hypothetical protein
MHSKSNHSQTYSCGYSPLKGMLILISSLKLSITPYAAGLESWGQYMAIYQYQTDSQLSLFVGFLIGTPRIKVRWQYTATLYLKKLRRPTSICWLTFYSIFNRELGNIQKRLPESENIIEKAKKDFQQAVNAEEKSSNEVICVRRYIK